MQTNVYIEICSSNSLLTVGNIIPSGPESSKGLIWSTECETILGTHGTPKD